jgi:hypothetical protein
MMNRVAGVVVAAVKDAFIAIQNSS